jgi:serine/threonine protein kinase
MSSDNLVGFKIASYEIVSPLGEGSSSSSFLARDDAKGKQAVAKRLSDDLAAQASVCASFLAVSELSSKVRMKKHVATVLSQKSSPEGTFLLREYVDGEPLSKIAAAGRLQELDADQIARNLCDAVRALSSRKVVHGGIHPGNVIIQPNGDAKLTDFATGRVCLQRSVDKHCPLDVLRYLPPEQWQGKEADSLSDIYAVGLIIAWLDRKRPIFDAGDLQALKAQICAGYKDLCPVLASAVAVAPNKRYPTIDELKSRLSERAGSSQKEKDEEERKRQEEEARRKAEEIQQRKQEEERVRKEEAARREAEARREEEARKRAEEERRKQQEEAESARKESEQEKPGPDARPKQKVVSFNLSVMDLDGTNLLAKTPPPPWKIPRDGRRVQRPLRLSHDASAMLDLDVSCVGDGATVSPQRVNVMPGRMSSVILSLTPDSGQFINLLLRWNEGSTEKTIVLKIVRTS